MLTFNYLPSFINVPLAMLSTKTWDGEGTWFVDEFLSGIL